MNNPCLEIGLGSLISPVSDGMKLVCINSINYTMQLTEGKTYIGLNISESANPYKTDELSDITIYLMDDLGQKDFYPSEIFLPIYKLRDRKLNQLGIYE